MRMNIVAASAAVGVLLFAAATGPVSARDAQFCDALDATAKTIVGGLRTIPSRAMMDGSTSPPVLIPGALDASAYENRGEISYNAIIYAGSNATTDSETAHRAYDETVVRVQQCFPDIQPLLEETGGMNKTAVFRPRYQVSVAISGGATVSGLINVSLEVRTPIGGRVDH